ncbi:MAG: hypothetical protein Q9220_003641 [cf. Caloplaca sp. 1 TL-2023]
MPGPEGSKHLNGKLPIANLENFMQEENDNIALVIVRHVSCFDNVYVGEDVERNLVYTESIAIKSSTLWDAIAAVAQCGFQNSQDDYSRSDVPQQIAGYCLHPAELFLYHHSSLLEKYMNEHPEAAKHIQVLLAYSDHKYGQNFAAATELFRTEHEKDIEKLFLPNTPVLVKGKRSEGADMAYVMCAWPRSSTLYEEGIGIECWSWQHSGKGMVRRTNHLVVGPISTATVTIQSLSIYPLSFASEQTKQNLKSRGTKYWSYRRSCHVSYTGWNTTHDEFYPGSRFMIDYKVYRKMHDRKSAYPYSDAPAQREYDTWPIELALDKDPSPDDYMLMPADVCGFYLADKQWVTISIEGVQPVQWNKSAFERLVLPIAHKELVQALVTVRMSQHGVKHGLGNTGKRVDIVAGKGTGLIILLHGGPGTGKTLTGETVAEIAEMPLYRVTCGDMGTTPPEVEKYMAAVMYLGTTWNCILLLDEADVFLEERSMSDLSRNSLVSVFLRILEHYDGILILTSNRVGIFDEAFKSRIQVALYYENLTQASRKQVWTNFIDMLEEDDEDVNFDEIRLQLNRLAAHTLNGRQIRNALTTARELAMFKAEQLDWKHIKQALKVSTDFSNYLKNIHGHTDDENARENQIR